MPPSWKTAPFNVTHSMKTRSRRNTRNSRKSTSLSDSSSLTQNSANAAAAAATAKEKQTESQTTEISRDVSKYFRDGGAAAAASVDEGGGGATCCQDVSITYSLTEWTQSFAQPQKKGTVSGPTNELQMLDNVHQAAANTLADIFVKRGVITPAFQLPSPVGGSSSSSSAKSAVTLTDPADISFDELEAEALGLMGPPMFKKAKVRSLARTLNQWYTFMKRMPKARSGNAKFRYRKDGFVHKVQEVHIRMFFIFLLGRKRDNKGLELGCTSVETNNKRLFVELFELMQVPLPSFPERVL